MGSLGNDDRFDVVIVGAGPAGIECAKTLGNSELSVMLIEKDKEVGRKPCAGGVIPGDLEYIPKKFLNSRTKTKRY